MTRWKAPMPKEHPKPGHAHLVFGLKTETGACQEFTGQIGADDAQRIMLDIIAASKKKPAAPSGA
ncbi:MAG: hypothetical protein V4724_26935 [Pseudomonadota bacterium]